MSLLADVSVDFWDTFFKGFVHVGGQKMWKTEAKYKYINEKVKLNIVNIAKELNINQK